MNKFFSETRHFFRIGIPMLGSQLSFMIMSATDTIVAGRAGADQLAGLVIANSFTYPIYMFLAGIILGTIYFFRGFGITAWSHAIYDLIVLTRITTE